jgi:tetratricopeptide (TPR) repeat protein
MSMNRILYVAVAAFWLSGCAGLPRQDQALTAAGGPSGSKTTPAGSSVLSDSIYGVLVGDIAAQRGQYQIAEKQYLYAARLSRNAGLAELATRAALAAKDLPAAAEAVAYWLDLKPDHIGALQIAALLAAQKGELDGAAEYLRRVVAIQRAKGENGYLDAIRLLTRIGRVELRMELARRLTAGHGEDPQALFALAIMEAGSHDFAAAERTTRKVLAKRPNWDEAQVLLIRALVARNDKQGARTAMEGFLAAAPKDVKLRATYARLLLEQNDLPAAKRQFERLYKDDPNDGDSLFALGVLALQMERRGEARNYLQRLYDLGDHRDDAAFYLGQLMDEDEKSDEALRWYGRVEGSNRFDAQVRVARIYAKRGEVSRAREILQQIRGHVGQDAIQMDLIEAEILREVKQYQAALDVLTRGLEKSPNNHELLYARALTAVNLGRVDMLEQDLKIVIEQDPKHADALNALGYTLADQTGRYQEALGYIQRALVLKPDSPAILDSMGWVQYRLGHPREALPYLKRAMELLPDAEIAAHLGEVLWAIGEQERARRIWREALNKDPGSEYILKMQERYGVRF